MLRILQKERTTSIYFVRKATPRFSVMGWDNAATNQGIHEPCAAKFSECVGTPIGLLLQDVVNIDLTRQLYFPTEIQTIEGGKVEILTSGLVVWAFEKRLRLPVGQPVYANPKTNQLTWKYLSKRVGWLANAQDKDGFCTIQLDFNIE